MKKLWMLVLLTLVAALGIMPAAAQDSNTLVDRLAGDAEGRFTTLVSALEAAGLADALSAEGDFTVFAPTNDAIDAALESLGLTASELLGNTDMLTQILTYHVVPEDRIFFREFGRTPSAVTLEGSEVALSIVDGVPMVNDVAISNIDRAASNGVFHVIEGVLLPPDLAEMVAAATPEATEVAETEVTTEATEAPSMDATAEASAEATEAPAMEATEMAGADVVMLDAMDENEAMLRFAFLSPDSPPLIFSINGEPVGDGSAAAAPVVTEWMVVPAGTMTVSGAPEGEGAVDLLYPFELALNDGTWTTLAIVGSEPNGTFIAQPVLEDYSPIAEGNARVTVFHGIENAPAIDLTADNRVVVERLAYPGASGTNDGAFVIEVAAGSPDLQIIQSGTANGGQNSAVVLVSLEAFELAPNSNTFIAAVGTPDEPDALAETIDMSTVPVAAE